MFPSIQKHPRLPFLGRLLHNFSPTSHSRTGNGKQPRENGKKRPTTAGSEARNHNDSEQHPEGHKYGNHEVVEPPFKLDLRQEAWNTHFEAPDLTELVQRVQKSFGLFEVLFVPTSYKLQCCQ